MVAAYTFNTSYRPTRPEQHRLPSLRLLEGGRFAPGQFAPVLIEEYQQFRLRFFRWGLTPAWTKAGRQAEKAFISTDVIWDNPASQLPVRRQRCLIPADGFYLDSPARQEALKAGKPNGETFCFAGIYDSWRQKDGSLLHSFAIITTAAPSSVAHLGLQVPLILPRESESDWLLPQTSLNKINQILFASPRQPLSVHPIAMLQLDEADLAAA